MAQVKVYGLASSLTPMRERLSDVVQECLVEAIELPASKRFHRFFPLAAEDFRYPADRSERYTIIEISMFEGRSVEARKRLLRLLGERLDRECGIAPVDLEVTITETPRHNWLIRGELGDELGLTYQVRV